MRVSILGTLEEFRAALHGGLAQVVLCSEVQLGRPYLDRVVLYKKSSFRHE